MWTNDSCRLLKGSCLWWDCCGLSSFLCISLSPSRRTLYPYYYRPQLSDHWLKSLHKSHSILDLLWICMLSIPSDPKTLACDLPKIRSLKCCSGVREENKPNQYGLQMSLSKWDCCFRFSRSWLSYPYCSLRDCHRSTISYLKYNQNEL